MKWTTEKPTQDGWYWYRPAPDDNRPLITWIQMVSFPITQTVEAFASCEELANFVDYISGEWAGPLEPPEEN
jgi:hypothetical protein